MSKSKVVFFNGNAQRVADIFCAMAPEGFEIAYASSKLSEEEKIKLLQGVEYVMLHPGVISGQILREAKSLKLIQSLTAGYDKIDLKAAKELNIPVATNGGANSWAVAEQSIALLLALYRRLIQCDKSVREGKWREAISGFNTFEIAGKTVGIIGAGNIGRKVARRLKAFEADIIYYDPSVATDIETELGARKVSIEELASAADIISLHAPLLKDTWGLLGKHEFSLMKPSAVIVNTSRAELIDQEAFLGALQSRRIAGAALDVFYQEPVLADDLFLKLDNVIVAPHTAGHTSEGWTRRIDFAWKNIQRVAGGQEPLSAARKD
ncbi:NAD(P)-dependent oxidoreductase [Acetonema longum]|uniref:Lactate dehydrogenase-like protein n=1 Tax=Acetonema longum DSM 6540 TaxID=1009370 RepID=F7NGL9_9FIRM|nr:NAD(P)-dependent oxidoreductase [Acetonema longum]EGO64823.1 lactate dehydrogenase-like protein [Acetonema longum DSM 6540]